ncbi:CDK5 regulatory subunit-associated protein 2 isoform X2 [Amia ocellicauda]|uniref:CDK5 regulatory subunit-associated protein 2 isoform X2 n=1 Tax=Amia ocellicauda TaxID=2972642 RepID=UPI0034642C8A
MDSVVGEDPTLPLDFNGSTNLSRLPDMAAVEDGEYTLDHVPVSTLPEEKMSPAKAWTMKDYENQITDLKKENFNLKLRIYFLEERMQQKFDDSSEDIYRTNIELKVEVESLKHELQEKQALLVTASKAVESLAGTSVGETRRVKEQAKREVEQLKDFFGKKIEHLEENLKAAQEDADKMAAIAEQEKVRNMDMEKQLFALSIAGPFESAPSQDLQNCLEEKERVIQQLSLSLKNKDALIEQLHKDAEFSKGSPHKLRAEQIAELSAAQHRKDGEIEALRNELGNEKDRYKREMQSVVDKQNEVSKLEVAAKHLTEELSNTMGVIDGLRKRLEELDEENKTLSNRLEEKENELGFEKRNSLKRDKTIQGFSLALKEKDKEIEELCHEIEDRDEALSKAREATHKAQIQKYQGAEEFQSLLTEKEGELAELLADQHAKLTENQRLQRALGRRDQELSDLQQAREQMEKELEDLQRQKKKGDKAINDLQNQLKKANGEMAEKEHAFEQQIQLMLSESKQKAQSLELTIKRLSSSLNEKDQLLQEYMNKETDQETSRSPDGREALLAKLRERLREKEKALEEAMDEKFAALEEKDNEIRQLHLSLREMERDLERLSNLLTHNEETINSLDAVIKERDTELQHLANTYKNLKRAKEEQEENWARALREKDSIISQLQQSLANKTKDLEEMANTLLSQTKSNAKDLAEQLSQRLKVAEAMLAEAMKDKERLVLENESAVEGLLATISSKDQLIQESAERYNRTLSDRSLEIQELRRQLTEKEHELQHAEKQSSVATQEKYLETAELKVLLTEKDTIINKLVESGQERDKFLAQLNLRENVGPQVLELRQTVQVLQERLHETEAELTMKNNEGSAGKIPIIKKSGVTLKKELAQKTEALNKALKKENDLRIEVAELRSLLADLENRNEAQAAHVESLTTTLDVKDDIILDLHNRLGKPVDSKLLEPQSQRAQLQEDRQIPGIPQRERTIIGGNSQQEVLPSLQAALSEHEELSRALKSEQQLYSSLVRTVKEPESAQRLHNLQLELTAVQLLRQQLEEGIKSNEDLRKDLEKEIQRAKRREGSESQSNLVDPKELEAMRHQLEDAHRWNASLQARLGEIQSRGGGVGGTNDTFDSTSCIADQTSYMSICLGEGLDGDLNNLSLPELRRKVSELLDYVKELQAQNAELQRRVSSSENPTPASDQKGKLDILALSSENKQLEKKLEEAVKTNKALHDQLNRESQKAAQKKVQSQLKDQSVQVSPETEKNSKSFLVDNRNPEEGKSVKSHHRSNESACCSANTDNEEPESVLSDLNANKTPSQFWESGSQLKTTDTDVSDGNQQEEMALLRSLLTESGASSVLQLRDEVLRLQVENIDLRGLLKEDKSTESKESSDSSGDGESKKDLQKVVEKLSLEVKSSRKIIKLLKEQLELNSSMDGETSFNPDLIVSMAKEIERLKTEHAASSKISETLEKKLVAMEAQQQRASWKRQNTSDIKDTSPEKFQHQETSRHTVSGSTTGMKSRLPVPIKPLKTTVNNKRAASHNTDPNSHLQTDHLLLEEEGLLSKHSQQRLVPPEPQRLTVTDENANTATIRANRDSDLLCKIELLQKELQNRKHLIAELEKRLQTAENTIVSQNDDRTRLDGNLQEVPRVRKAVQEKNRFKRNLENTVQQTEAEVLSVNTCMSYDPSACRGTTDANLQLIKELQSALEEKHQQNKQLEECLQAAEATIESLTPCEMGGGRNGQTPDSEFQQQLEELQNALHEKDQLNKELEECLNAAELTISSLTADDIDNKARDPQSAITDLQQQVEELQKALQEKEQRCELLEKNVCLAESTINQQIANRTSTLQNKDADLHLQVDHLQKALWEKSRINSELQERLYAAEMTIEHQNADRDAAGQNVDMGLCRRVEDLPKGHEEQKQLNKELKEQPSTTESNKTPSEKYTDVRWQVEKLQKALKEKRHICKVLEERLRAAESTIAQLVSQPRARGASQQAGVSLEQDDKEVQVDLQDLGYETYGKSENEVDREENGSPDNDSQLKQHASEPSIPLLLKQMHGNFFSMENLDTNTTTSYPSSPALSSPKISMKSLQMYDDYGFTDNLEQLKQQVLELKAQLENNHRVIRHLQSLLRRNSLSSDLLTISSDPGHSVTGKLQDEQVLDHEELPKDSQELSSHKSSGIFSRDHSQNQSFPLSQEQEEKQMLKDQITNLGIELDKEKALNKNLAEQLQQIQFKTRSTSPARFDSLVQSQARELSQLRQQIKESRGLGSLQRHQLKDLSKAFEELLQASDVDYYIGEVFREQLDQSLTVLEKLEDRLDNGDAYLNNEDGALLELTQRQSCSLLLASPDSLQQEITFLRKQLEDERRQLQKQLKGLVRQNQNLAEATKEQLDLLTRELQEKNRTIQRLQQQVRSQSLELTSGHPSSDSDTSDRSAQRPRDNSSTTPLQHRHGRTPEGIKVPNGEQTEEASHQPSVIGCSARKSYIPENGADDHSLSLAALSTEDAAVERDDGQAQNKYVHGLQRENSLLLEKLKNSEQLNDTLRSELDLHRTILTNRAETGSPRPPSPPRTTTTASQGTKPPKEEKNEAPSSMNADLLAEHLQEIRSLRQHLEESIRTNDRLREQLERKLAEAERDPASTNIFIHGSEEPGQLANEVRFLWGQNQALKEQLSLGSRDKQKENEKLRESLAKKNAKLEYLRNECDAVKKENSRLQGRLSSVGEENKRLKDALRYSRDEIDRLQCEINIQRQQLADSHQLLQSLRVELQVYEQIKTASDKKTVSEAGLGPAEETRTHSPGGLDLHELLSEIRHLRIQLERSIQTNNALRQKLEEQLLRGPAQAEGSPSTININYLLSGEHRHSALSGHTDNMKSPTHDGCEPFPHPAFHGSPNSGRSSRDKDVSNLFQEMSRRAKTDIDRVSQCSGSSADSTSPTPSRLVPGHRLWANKHGRHILGLLEDYNALRKQISEGKMLTNGMDKRLQECFHALSHKASESKVLDQRFLKGFSTNVNTMQQVLEEASRLLKLLWRVSLPTNVSVNCGQSQQDELLKNEIARLKSKLSQQEKMLTGTVKRLRTTNQLKEGMEKVIIHQLSLTHGVLKKARGNLEVPSMEETPVNGS